MRVPVVMMEWGRLEMGVASGLLVGEQAVLGRTGSVGSDGLQILHWLRHGRVGTMLLRGDIMMSGIVT